MEGSWRLVDAAGPGNGLAQNGRSAHCLCRLLTRLQAVDILRVSDATSIARTKTQSGRENEALFFLLFFFLCRQIATSGLASEAHWARRAWARRVEAGSLPTLFLSP